MKYPHPRYCVCCYILIQIFIKLKYIIPSLLKIVNVFFAFIKHYSASKYLVTGRYYLKISKVKFLIFTHI